MSILKVRKSIMVGIILPIFAEKIRIRTLILQFLSITL